MITREILTENITALSREALLGLSRFHNTACISIYIPTHRAGMETLNGQDSKNLKNQLREVKLKLQSEALSAGQIEYLLKPVTNLVEDSDFWRFQKEGLAVFVSDEFFEKYVIPVKVREFNYISSELYLVPLLPLFNDEELFSLADKREKFLIGFDKGKSSVDIREIVHASVTGRTDTIFIEKNSDAFGIFDPASGVTIIEEEHKTANVSLMNLAARKTFEQGGIVYLLDRDEMPDGSVDINALFRY